MASKQHDDEFELILGNKQLLSLFFMVVVFFAAFFSVGYWVGYSHGEETSVASTDAMPTRERPPVPESVLREEPPAPKPPASIAAKEEPKQEASKPAESKPKPAASEAKPTPTRAAAPAPKPAPKPEPKKAEPKPAPPPAAKPAAAVAAAGGAYHVQVAALRVRKDADMLANKLKEKGYPAAINEKGDGYVRVVVGPFASAEAAKTYRSRLSKDGFDTMIRKL